MASSTVCIAVVQVELIGAGSLAAGDTRLVSPVFQRRIAELMGWVRLVVEWVVQ